MGSVNSVVIVGRLVRDPELKYTPSGQSVCSMRVAVDRAGAKNNETGEIGPGFFNVEAWGKQGENAAQYLAKGRQAGFVGSLKFREWEAQDGTKRSAVDIVAFQVQFLGSASEREQAGEGEAEYEASQVAIATDVGSTVGDFDDGIPF